MEQPHLKFAFLEGGVGWACTLFNDLVEHWKLRNVKAMQKLMDPSKLDRSSVADILVQYGGARYKGLIEQMGAEAGSALPPENLKELDDWSALTINGPADFATMFSNFYFGCEGGDRTTKFAFDTDVNACGARLQPLYGSDIGHFDVADITAAFAEAYEQVEEGLLTEDQFRDFTFGNVAKLHASMNPNFFNGTSVEQAVKELAVV